MSIFADQEKISSVYHADDSNTTKKTTYPATADFTIMMNIIRRNEDIIAYAGSEIGQYVSNVNGNYTNASNITKGDKIVQLGQEFIVVNRPRFNRLFNRYKVILNSSK